MAEPARLSPDAADPLLAFLDAELHRSVPPGVPEARDRLYRQLLDDLRARVLRAASGHERAFLAERVNAVSRLRQEEQLAGAIKAAPDADGAGSEPFGLLLKRFRQRAGLRQSVLARRTGVDRAYVYRMEKMEPEPCTPSRQVVESLAVALELSRSETDALFVAAGHVPPSVHRIGGWTPEFDLVAEILLHPDLSEQERAQFRQALHLLAGIWLHRQPA